MDRADDFGGVLRLWQEQDRRATAPHGLTLGQAIEFLRAEGAARAAISATKPSLTPEIVAEFEDDTQRFGRD